MSQSSTASSNLRANSLQLMLILLTILLASCGSVSQPPSLVVAPSMAPEVVPITAADSAQAFAMYATNEFNAWDQVDRINQPTEGGANFTPQGVRQNISIQAIDSVFTDDLVTQCKGYAVEIAEAANAGKQPEMSSLLGSLKCRALMDTAVVVFPTKENGEPDLANVQSFQISDKEKIKVACGVIASKVTLNATSDPTVAMIAGPAGAYACGSYLEAILRKDPMLILAPSLIPTLDLADDTFREVERAINRLRNDPTLGPVVGVVAEGGLVVVASYDLVSGQTRGVLKQTSRLAQSSAGLFSTAGRSLPRVTMATPRVTLPPISIPQVTLPRCYKVFGKKVCP